MADDSPQHDPLPARPTCFIYVLLPENIEPDERHDRYATALDVELRLADLGAITGGGTMTEDDANGDPVTLLCGIDADVHDVAAARQVMRDYLPDLGCRAGTQLQYRVEGEARCDLFDGDAWWLGLDPEGLPEGPCGG